MKFKHCTEETEMKLRKASVKRMHRPHKQEAMLKGRDKYNMLFMRLGLNPDF